jgi:hypothetical protein
MKTGKTGIDKYTKATSNQSAAQKVANSRMKGTAGAIEQLKGSVETVLLRFGQAIAPAVQGGLKLVTKGVNAIPGVFTRIGSLVSGAVAKWKITPMGKKITNAFKGFNISSLGTTLATQAKSWAKPVIDGFKTGLNTGDWSGLGSALGNGITKALAGLGAMGVKLSAAFGALFASIDWVGIGIAIGQQVPTLLAGLAVGLLTFDFGACSWALRSTGRPSFSRSSSSPSAPSARSPRSLPRSRSSASCSRGSSSSCKGGPRGSWAWSARLSAFLGRSFMSGFRRVFPVRGQEVRRGPVDPPHPARPHPARC